METEDIEKLKKAAFAAAELLKSLPHHGSFHGADRAEIISKIEAFKPKPEPMECWAVSWKSGHRTFYYTEQEAKAIATSHDGITHLREVTPAPAPESPISDIEAFKPELFKCWANVYHDGSCMGFTNKETALIEATPKHVRSAVHLREVTPAPEWERWDEEKVSTLHGERNWKEAFTDVAVAHNAEMRRVTGTEGK